MKENFARFQPLIATGLCALLTGCLLKPATVTTRRFVLASPQPERQTDNTNQLAVGLGRVALPDYLLKDAMAVRRGDNEVVYLEDALWAERLDHSFGRALAAHLASQLSTSRIRFPSWQPGEVTLAVRVNVDRLDVAAQGRGTLVARWQIEAPDSGKLVKSGESRFTNSGASPYTDPATIATALSDLTAQFGQVLAQAVRESAPAGTTP
jgi:hypothetical protein